MHAAFAHVSLYWRCIHTYVHTIIDYYLKIVYRIALNRNAADAHVFAYCIVF